MSERASMPRRRRNLAAMVAAAAVLLCVGGWGRAVLAQRSASEAGTESAPFKVDASGAGRALASTEGGGETAGAVSDRGGRLARGLLLFLALGLLPVALRSRRG